MNKKILTFGLMGLFAMALVVASVVTYYGTIEQEINVELPISIDGLSPESLSAFAGEQITGDLITITNDAPFDVLVSITNDAPIEIAVEYIGSLELSKKVVDFDAESWDLVDDKVEVEYTVVGDSFNAEVTSPIAGYELVYYKDNSDRFDNPATTINVSEVVGNLPYEADGNADEYDMCAIEGYSECHGAKIWYVPSDAVVSGVIDWSRASEFYFETNLIQYNANGDVTVYSGLEITPVYDVDAHFEGSAIVTTIIA